MKYQAIDSILPRHGHGPGINEILAEYADALDQPVNFGTHVLTWLWDSFEQRQSNIDPHLPSATLLRHGIELVDAISILVRNSCSDASKVNVRALVETFLSMKYLLMEDTERRGMCYLTRHIHDRIAAYEANDPDTERGKHYRVKIAKDSLVSSEFLDSLEMAPGTREKIGVLI